MPNNHNADEMRKTEPKVKVFGDPDVWELQVKASTDRWMKSTKRMAVPGGYLYQTSTEFRDESGNVTACSDALAFVPSLG